MGLLLTDEDREIIAELRSANVLQDVDAHRITVPSGFMALMCSDCDQFADKTRFLRTVSRTQCRHERIHLFALNGGGTLLSPHSPTCTMNEYEVLKKHVEGAMAMKRLDMLVSKCHAPCGAAYAHNMNFHAVLQHTFKGKLFVKDGLPKLKVAVFPHVDYGPQGRSKRHKKKTYAVTLHDWVEFALRKNII